LLKEIKKFGLGADVVSAGELIMALKAGINPNKIVFSGVGKTSEEINFAIKKKYY
jgi:diaminopimelate decarboxylase